MTRASVNERFRERHPISKDVQTSEVSSMLVHRSHSKVVQIASCAWYRYQTGMLPNRRVRMPCMSSDTQPPNYTAAQVCNRERIWLSLRCPVDPTPWRAQLSKGSHLWGLGPGRLAYPSRITLPITRGSNLFECAKFVGWGSRRSSSS